ncbi:hypothetical protein [Maridesulfovibrio salexigens]|uniref:Uncharacterized protein n=1 Tax=Maridesulfovibrio salexigens (strain ATCC 14822 / DSM 2638 / NCIMB 8403 / VKM B-1763) TaxID=526222 RepID=C6BWD5_MARSD|nr:hypothetical protein [Maridesulfovibrio salexigens]ACS78379.1 hypothetical protein Desal_0312 [Maridesulfovibrio salexigens DSM 2638]
MRSSGIHQTISLFILTCCTLIMGCGSVTVSETRYYAVSNADGEANIYRLKIEADTDFTEGKYASGWYPKNSVDSLTGAVNADQAVKDLATRKAIEDAINSEVEKTYKNWLKVASNSNSTDKERERVLNTLRLVTSFPARQGEGINREGMVYIEFDPTAGVRLRHSDEKMVFMLSSDPSKVINAINSFTQSTDTALSITQLSSLFGNQANGEYSVVIEDIAAYKNKCTLISQKMSAVSAIETKDETSRKSKVIELENLIEMLKSMN